MSWNKEWTKNLDISVYEPYPLQFANVERIEKNDAIYIFDETGCGKTISAGLMALHYLYNNPEKNVLVITVPQLVSSNQFIEEWYGGERKPAKLPFKSCGIKRERIEIINYDYRNIANCSGKWGLIIIDEAHYFLEAEKRIDAIKNLRAEKIIFMTATPIKKSSDDLEKYSKLADIILNIDVSRDWIKRLLCNDEQGQDFICSSFDYDSPVTRYFKDTVNALALEYNLTNKEASNGKAVKKAPIREVVLLPYKENGEIEEIANYIADNRKKETEEEIQIDYERKIVLKKNRFVIFTRFIDKEARALETFLKNDDRFIGFHNDNPENKITYIRIDGTEDTDNIDKYTNNGFDKEYNEKDLPEVIIITYQIAEAGVNLPGYNYIINYHIPAFPSSLEQRFGRVDRLGKQNGSATLHKKIYMVYPLNPSPLESDTYKTNYYIANWMFRKMMINYLPAKNTILSPEILNNLVDNKDKLVEKLERFKTLCNKDGRLEKVCSELNRLSDTKTENKKSDQEWDDDICDLIDYCDKKGIYSDESNSILQFKKDLLEKIEEDKEDIIESPKASSLSERFAEQLEIIGSKIFIGNINDNSNWNLIDAVEEDVETEAGNKLKGCYERIKDLEGYKKYCENFKIQIKEPLEKARIDKILFGTRGGADNWRIVDQISYYIFDLFKDNKDIDAILLSEDQEYVKDVLKGFDFIEGLKPESREEEKALLLKYPRYVIEKTFFHRFFIWCINRVNEHRHETFHVPSRALSEAFIFAYNEYYHENEKVVNVLPFAEYEKFEFDKANFSITNHMKLFCYCNNLELYRTCYILYREYGNFLKLCVPGQGNDLSAKYEKIKKLVKYTYQKTEDSWYNVGAILFTYCDEPDDCPNPFYGYHYPWRMEYKGTKTHCKILPEGYPYTHKGRNMSVDLLQYMIDSGIENDSKKLDFGTTMFFSEIIMSYLGDARDRFPKDNAYKVGFYLIARNICKVLYNKAFNDNYKLRNVLEQYDISDYIEREVLSNKK